MSVAPGGAAGARTAVGTAVGTGTEAGVTRDSADVVVIGAGAIGTAAAFHAARAGASVILIDRLPDVASGTTAQSSCIVRTHYSVAENVELARQSLDAFRSFPAYLSDADAECGLNLCGYLIVGADDMRGRAIGKAMAAQRALGIDARMIDASEAREILPLLATGELAHFGYERDAGYADAYMTAASFARAARRLGARVLASTEVLSLVREGRRVVGVRTAGATIGAGAVIVATNVWSARLIEPLGATLPLVAERHEVIALQAPQPYLPHYPVFKDISGESMLYARCYGRTQLLVSPGLPGTPADPDEGQTDVSLDFVAALGEQVASRLPVFAEAGLASSWTGLYDVTPDWNPVLGALPGVAGLTVAFGFSGHGFKLSPAVGRLLAGHALGAPEDALLHAYRFERFAEGKPMLGLYGAGAVS